MAKSVVLWKSINKRDISLIDFESFVEHLIKRMIYYAKQIR